ncbi:MAG TPA: hypothetical protein VFS53_00670 [Gemmatimonadota bacterium]|nr:hypothetical protein [Gemmatimonadota bacterium]
MTLRSSWIRKLSRAVRDLKRAALATALGLALTAPLNAQATDPRAAQAEFERARIARLPWSREPAGGPCDEVVGRFCYRRESGTDRPPLPEPAGVAELRDALIAVLDAAAGGSPEDPWIAGQRIRYRIEAGRAREAAGVAAACAAERWWCAALEGAALHAAGDFAVAERAFDRALAAMPAEERERWTDVAPILDAPSQRLWRGLGGGAREAFAHRVWWSADPLWSVPGNELRAEHFARRTWNAMQEGAASAYGVPWGADLEELLVRYGWPVAWERSRDGVGRLGGSGPPAVVARDPPGARRFVPTLAAIADPAAVEAADWGLEDPRPRATYAPAYARRFLGIEPQIAAFRRGEDAILAVGWALPADSVAAGATVTAVALASEGPDRPIAEARSASARPGGALALRVPWPRAVVSVEALGGGAAGRWRGGIELPGSRPGPPAVSDLLLLRPSSSLPATLEDAIPRAREEAAARPGESLPIFWETYPGPGFPGGPATFALGIRTGPAGLATRIARALGFRGGAAGAELRWTEDLAPGAVVPRAVRLELPDLAPGDYLLELEVSWPDGSVSRASRAVSVAR